MRTARGWGATLELPTTAPLRHDLALVVAPTQFTTALFPPSRLHSALGESPQLHLIDPMWRNAGHMSPSVDQYLRALMPMCGRPVFANGKIRSMPTSGLPTALRAMASLKTTWFGRRKRVFCFDARYPDGHVETQVNVDQVLQGQQFPADAWATRDAAKAACPNVGQGPWVEYATGRLVE